MGRPKQQFTNVRAVSKSTIEIVFRYPTPKDRQRETIKHEPTPANLKRCYVHLAQINEAIKAGTFDYITTFPDSPRTKLYSSQYTFGTFLKEWLDANYNIGAGTRIFYHRIIHGQVLALSVSL